MIAFGPWSTLLASGMGFGLLVAGLLISLRQNVSANRLLAAMLVVVSLKLGPYVLGFAGFFDAYPWLSFVPLSFGLALGPLLYLHVLRLSSPGLPRAWHWHFLPVALQFAYYLVLFPQPLDFKNAFALRWDGPLIDPVETWLELLSLLVYLVAAMRRHRAYQAWLDATLSNREEFRLDWLGRVLRAMLLMLPLWIAFEVASALGDFNYFQRIPLYLGFTGLLLYLGLEGWRHAGLVYPLAVAELPKDSTSDVAALPQDVAGDGRDWSVQGCRWRDQLQAAGWWRDPELSLDRLARHLGTNTSYLSRAFNQGLGLSFNAVVNQLRVEAVQAQLDAPEACGDLLALGLAAGFNSKTSFNRVFKAQLGETPSAYRAQRLSRSAKA